MAKLRNIPIWITSYIGIEFKEVGRTSKCDCWGLVRRVLKEIYDVEVPRYDDYESTKELDRLAMMMNEGRQKCEWFQIVNGKEKLGDVVLFQMQGQLCHVGLCLANGYMLHIQKGKNSCIEKYRGLRWNRRIHSFYRHEKMLSANYTEAK